MKITDLALLGVSFVAVNQMSRLGNTINWYASAPKNAVEDLTSSLFRPIQDITNYFGQSELFTPINDLKSSIDNIINPNQENWVNRMVNRWY